MSELPDLDTSDMSFIAYWNAIEQGNFDEVDVGTMLENDSVESYTLYDNGAEGMMIAPNGREHGFRLKSDGWIITYMDTYADFGVNISFGNEDLLQGPFDIANDWYNEQSAADFHQDSLSEGIRGFQQEMNPDVDGFEYDDVGVYWMADDGVSGMTGISNYVLGSSTYDYRSGFLYTDATEVYAGYVCTATSDYQYSSCSTEFEGEMLADSSTNLGALDALNNGLIPDADTEYEFIQSSGANNNDRGSNSATAVLVWG